MAGVDVCVGVWSCVDKDVRVRGVVGVFFIGWGDFFLSGVL